MATITITVQSILNSATFDSYTVDNGITVNTLASDIATAVGIDASWFTLRLGITHLVGTATLAASAVINGSVLHTNNRIAHLATRQDRQTAKLILAQIRRQAGGNTAAPYYRAHNVYDITELPTQYSGNTIVDNPNNGGLILGRPWAQPRATFTDIGFTYGSATVTFNLYADGTIEVLSLYGAGGYPYGDPVVPHIVMTGDNFASIGGTTPANDIVWAYVAPTGVITQLTYYSGSFPL